MLSMFFFASNILLGLQLARSQAYRFELLLYIHTSVHAHPAFPCMCTYLLSLKSRGSTQRHHQMVAVMVICF